MKPNYMPEFENKGKEEHREHYQLKLDDGEFLNVEYALLSNKQGSFDAWVGVSVFGDTKRIYQNGKRMHGNPRIENKKVLEALDTLPKRIKRYIEDLK